MYGWLVYFILFYFFYFFILIFVFNRDNTLSIVTLDNRCCVHRAYSVKLVSVPRPWLVGCLVVDGWMVVCLVGCDWMDGWIFVCLVGCDWVDGWMHG